MTSTRDFIVCEFAKWTALSATRSGAVVKDRRRIYGLLDKVDFYSLFDPTIEKIDRYQFDRWHEAAIHRLCSTESELSVGWAAKLINVYLKTRAYLPGTGFVEGNQAKVPAALGHSPKDVLRHPDQIDRHQVLSHHHRRLPFGGRRIAVQIDRSRTTMGAGTNALDLTQVFTSRASRDSRLSRARYSPGPSAYRPARSAVRCRFLAPSAPALRRSPALIG